MKKLLGALFFLLTLFLILLGIKHLIFLEITRALSRNGSFAYAEEGFSRIRVFDYRGKNFRIRELNFLLIPDFPRLFIGVAGRDGEVSIRPGEGSSSSLNLPSLIKYAEFQKMKIRVEKGDFIASAEDATVLYSDGTIEVRSENTRIEWKEIKVSGSFASRITSEGELLEAEFTGDYLKLRARSSEDFLVFSFSAEGGKNLPWKEGKILGQGKMGKDLLEVSGRGENLFLYRGRLREITFQLKKRGEVSWKVQTREGDTVIGRGTRFRIPLLRWRTVAEIAGFPLKPDVLFRGQGRWNRGRLELELTQKEGGKLNLSYGKRALSLVARNLSFERHLLNFQYDQAGNDASLKLTASTRDASSFVKEAGDVYRYFSGEELFQPLVEGTGFVNLNYRFSVLGNDYSGEGGLFLQEGKVYNYYLKNLRVSWKDSNRNFSVTGGFRWERGEGKFEGEGPREDLKINFSGWAMMEDLLKAAEVDTEVTGKLSTKGTLSLKGEIPVIEGEAELPQGMVFNLFPFSGKGNYIQKGEDFSTDFYGKIYRGIFRGSLRAHPGNSRLRISVEGFQVQAMSDSLTGTGFASIITRTRGEEVITTLSMRVENFGYPDDEKGNLTLTGNYYISGEGDQRVFTTANLQGKALCKVIMKGEGRETVRGTIEGNCPRAGGLLPWPGTRMKLRLNGDFAWKEKDFQYRLKINGRGPVLTLLSYPQPVENFALTAEARGRRLEFKILDGTLGGGKVKGEGRLEFASPLKIDSSFTLKNCEFYPFRGVEARGSARVYVRNKGERINIEGELVLDSGKWEREFEQSLEFSSRPAGPMPPWINRIFLRLNITSREGIRLKNSWGNLLIFPDITLVGPVMEPMMSGIVNLTDGFIWVSERRFTVKQGRIYLSPGLEFDPYIDVEAEALIKHYRVNMKIQGLLSHMHVSLSSFPPLPTHELFSLLALGERFRRGISQGSSSQITSSSLISQVLSTRIGKKARSFLGLSRLSISPNLVRGTTLASARLTAEKQVGEKLTVVYSTDLSGAKKGIIILEYKINPSVSLVLTKDETDNYILDIIYYPSIR